MKVLVVLCLLMSVLLIPMATAAPSCRYADESRPVSVQAGCDLNGWKCLAWASFHDDDGQGGICPLRTPYDDGCYDLGLIPFLGCDQVECLDEEVFELYAKVLPLLTGRPVQNGNGPCDG